MKDNTVVKLEKGGGFWVKFIKLKDSVTIMTYEGSVCKTEKRMSVVEGRKEFTRLLLEGYKSDMS